MFGLLRNARLLCNRSNKLNSPLKVQLQCRSIHDMEKSTVSILNQESTSGLMINSYSQEGFRLNNGMMAFGPIAIFPKTVLSWNVKDASGITEESLSLFYTLEPKIDILVIGVGDIGEKIDLKLLKFMRDKRISLEVSATERACAIFNFLNVEGRCVAGALIPPTKYRINEDDLASSKRRSKELMMVEDSLF